MWDRGSRFRCPCLACELNIRPKLLRVEPKHARRTRAWRNLGDRGNGRHGANVNQPSGRATRRAWAVLAMPSRQQRARFAPGLRCGSHGQGSSSELLAHSAGCLARESRRSISITDTAHRIGAIEPRETEMQTAHSAGVYGTFISPPRRLTHGGWAIRDTVWPCSSPCPSPCVRFGSMPGFAARDCAVRSKSWIHACSSAIP